MVAALVAGQPFLVDARQAFDGRRADQEDLAARECGGARFGQADRVALAFQLGGIGVDFVQEQVAGRHRAQRCAAVRAADDHDAAGPFLEQRRVAGIAGAGRGNLRAQRRRVLDHRGQALF